MKYEIKEVMGSEKSQLNIGGGGIIKDYGGLK